jgi:UDP-glucose 4-epimerase
MSRIAITGAGGFIGRALVPALKAQGHDVRALHRAEMDVAEPESVTPDLFVATDTVIHLAGMAHSDSADEERLHAVNAAGAGRTARAAARAGVARFVLVSTALVHGSATHGAPVTEKSPLRPDSAYAASKLAGERAVQTMAADTGMSVCVLRPPLVHGPGAGGNIARLAAWARRGWPLPAAAKNNRRSVIEVDNLVSALRCVATHPNAAGEIFLVSDGPPVSTADLYASLSRDAGRRARFLPIPSTIMRLGLATVGRSRDFQRLMADFEVDSDRITHKLGWRPDRSLL